MREQGFELREHRLDRHRGNLRELTGVTIKRNPPGALNRTLSRLARIRSPATARAAPLPPVPPVPPRARTAARR
ncbi:hypothetical protein GQF42_16590 [Streptomyces broussonetiae]|uniref:Uncharacterized protein n=1 Tax=Streptomyces broussonetiae TaxID=2686304 RepID=A0A6I6MZX6_9ACTN|nr:hypothetical protein GQF42_16590 [Streptomyces broussonetiae]